MMFQNAPNSLGSRCGVGLADTLAAVVRSAFPALSINNWRIDQSGGDHVLLLVDDDIVFRFPRSGMHNLDLEIAVLSALKMKLSIATPRYDYIDPAGCFAGYRYLAGFALAPARFAALSQKRQDDLAKSAAQFLLDLHHLSPDEVAFGARWPKLWSAAEFSERGRVERLIKLARFLPNSTRAIERFYASYLRDRPPSLVVVHGDLVPEHILVDQWGRLSGIIDFGDVALGDPAQDFLGFWAYGDKAVCRIVDLYGQYSADRGILRRSRNHFIRYRLDQLYENIGNFEFDCVAAAAEIEALIAA